MTTYLEQNQSSSSISNLSIFTAQLSVLYRNNGCSLGTESDSIYALLLVAENILGMMTTGCNLFLIFRLRMIRNSSYIIIFCILLCDITAAYTAAPIASIAAVRGCLALANWACQSHAFLMTFTGLCKINLICLLSIVRCYKIIAIQLMEGKERM